MMSPFDAAEIGRSLGLLGATGVGVGAIVGGGILALAGVAFATTGPSAIVAFALNGPTVRLPLTDREPDQLPEALQLSASVAFQLN